VLQPPGWLRSGAASGTASPHQHSTTPAPTPPTASKPALHSLAPRRYRAARDALADDLRTALRLELLGGGPLSAASFARVAAEAAALYEATYRHEARQLALRQQWAQRGAPGRGQQGPALAQQLPLDPNAPLAPLLAAQLSDTLHVDLVWKVGPATLHAGPPASGWERRSAADAGSTR
jgi:hypothetical protein